MTARDDFDLRVAELIDELAAERVPEYLVEIQTAARRHRQRPAWRIPEWWLPVDLTPARRLVPVNGAAWLIVIGLLLAVIAAALIAGSRGRVPPPFGPAANGVVIADDGSDIVAIDPDAGTIRSLVPGPAFDTRPSFSLDGRRIAFLREEGTRRSIVVAEPDGSGPRVLLSVDSTDGSFIVPEPVAWAPDGTRFAHTVVVTKQPAHAEIWIVDVESGTHRVLLPASLFGVEGPAWAPDGRRIAFLGQPGHRPESFLYVSDVDGQNLVRVSDRASSSATGYLQFPRWSPDGTRIAVHYGDSVRMDRDVLVLATDRVDEREVAGSRADEAQAAWSPDGRRLAYWRSVDDERVWQVVIADLDGATERALPFESGTADSLSWAPDGSRLVVTDCPGSRCNIVLLDALHPGAEPAIVATVPAKSYEESYDRAYWSWQRLAP